MRLRELAAGACRMLGIFVGVQAIRSFAIFIDRLLVSAPFQVYTNELITFVLLAAAATVLWIGAEPLGERIAHGAVAYEERAMSATEVVTLAVWLLGLFLAVVGFASLLGHIVQALAARPARGFFDFLPSREPVPRPLIADNAERRAAIVLAITNAITAGVGVVVIAKADAIAAIYRRRRGPAGDEAS